MSDRSKRILVIEDNKMNFELVKDVLEIYGYEILEAGTAELGLVVAARENPDLILMDISLPGMDGLTATRKLKAEPETEGIPVIALTAHAMKGDEEEALAAGCEGYIAKPVDINGLPIAVAHFVDKK